MKVILALVLLVMIVGCAEAGKVINQSVNNIQYSTNSFTANNYVGLTEAELFKKMGKPEKEISLAKNKKLLYGRRSDAYLIFDGKVERAYLVSDVAYEVKYNSVGALKDKNKSIGFASAMTGVNANDVSFVSAVEPIKNLLKFKGYNVVENTKNASVVIHVKYGSQSSLEEIKNLDPAFFKAEKKSKDWNLRYLDLDAKEKNATIWNYKALSVGSKSSIEPAVAAMAFAGYNDIPKSSMGPKTSTISETDPVFDIIGRDQN